MAAEKTRLDRITEETLKRRRQSLSQSMSRSPSHGSQYFRSSAAESDSDSDHHPSEDSRKECFSRLPSRSSRSYSHRSSVHQEVSTPLDGRARSISGRGKTAYSRARAARKEKRASISRQSCLRWSITMIQNVLRFDDDPEVQADGSIPHAHAKHVTIHEDHACSDPSQVPSARARPHSSQYAASCDTHTDPVSSASAGVPGKPAGILKGAEIRATQLDHPLSVDALSLSQPTLPCLSFSGQEGCARREPHSAYIHASPQLPEHSSCSSKLAGGPVQGGIPREHAGCTALLLSLPPKVPHLAAPEVYQFDLPTPSMCHFATPAQPPAHAPLGHATPDWYKFLNHCQAVQSVVFSAPPTPSLAPFVREYPKSAPQQPLNHAPSQPDSSHLSTPDADPQAVLQLWKDMGRALPQCMRHDSLPSQSMCQPQALSPASEMQYEPNAIFDDVLASEQAAKLVQLFAEPKLAAVATGDRVATGAAARPGKQPPVAHRAGMHGAANSSQRHACVEPPSIQDDRQDDGEQHVKFTMHESHATGTQSSAKQPRYSSIRGASGASSQQSEAYCSAAFKLQEDAGAAVSAECSVASGAQRQLCVNSVLEHQHAIVAVQQNVSEIRDDACRTGGKLLRNFCASASTAWT